MPPAGSDRTRAAFALGLALVAAVYASGFANGFVWLDHAEILEGRLVVRSLGEALSLFAGDRNYPGYFRPVYDILHSIDLALWGEQPHGFHLSSLLLHLATASLLRFIALRLGVDARAATFGVLVWALHPIAIPAVGLIHAKADLAIGAALAGSFALFLASGGRGRLVASLASLAVALYAKETAYLFGVALLPFVRRLSTLRPDARAWLIAVLAVTVCAAVHRSLVVPGDAYGSPLALPERLATFATVYVGYVAKLVWPAFPSVADTTVRWSALAGTHQAMYAIAFLVIVGLQVVLALRRPTARPFLVLFHVALLPVSQVVPILHFRADRFLYLPSIGFVGAALCALSAAGERWPAMRGAWRAHGRWLGAWILVFVVAAAHGVSVLRSFRDDRALMGRELGREPRYREGLAVLARDAERAGDFALAERLYAASLAPDDRILSYVDGDAVVVNRTNALLRLGRIAEAADFSERFIDHVKGEEARLVARYNQAIALRILGRSGEALPGLLAFARSRPDDARAAFLVGQAAADMGDAALAIEYLQRYLRLAPGAPDRDAVERRLAELVR